jgi:hypothetical protein
LTTTGIFLRNLPELGDFFGIGQAGYVGAAGYHPGMNGSTDVPYRGKVKKISLDWIR